MRFGLPVSGSSNLLTIVFHCHLRRFLCAEILQSYWLSGPYGRNWSFLWSNTRIPTWGILIMVLIFFIGVWGVLLAILTKLSKTHSWILCVFAVGLGCPRWCQMLWGTSSLARA